MPSCQPVVVIPARIGHPLLDKGSIAEDMLAVGLYDGMKNYCSAFERLRLYMDRLWEQNCHASCKISACARNCRLQSEDVLVTHLAWSGTRLRVMGNQCSILEKSAGSLSG